MPLYNFETHIKILMISKLKNTLKKSILHLVDLYGQNHTGRIKTSPDPKIWGHSISNNGTLVIGDIDIDQLVKEYGTPLHVVDKNQLEQTYTQFKESFSSHYSKIEIAYSYKTNPLPTVIKKLHTFGADAEVISHFELWLALHLGVPSKKIVFNGPGKSIESLQLAVEKKIKIINIDSSDEITLIAKLAKQNNTIQAVGIRLITSVGWAGQFGLPIATGMAWQAITEIKGQSNLNLIGLHLHLGTGIKDVSIYLQAIDEALEFATRLKKEAEINIKYIDLGGGFSISTVSPYSGLDHHLMSAGFPPWLPDFSAPSTQSEDAKRIMDKIKEYYDPSTPESPTFVFEPGRALTGKSQLLLLKVLTIKPAANGEINIILDGGRNIIMPPTWEHHAVLPASKMNTKKGHYYNIYGPLCHPGDMLFQGRWMPELEVGDIVAIMDTGAYFIPNQMNFSNPRTAVVIVDGDEVKVARKRERFEDIVSLDSF